MKLKEAIQIVDVPVAAIRGSRQEREALEQAWALIQSKAMEKKGDMEKKQ